MHLLKKLLPKLSGKKHNTSKYIMRRSAHYPSRDDPSWDTAPEEYVTRHMRTERTPVVRGGRYQYPDAQMITKGRIIFDEDQIGCYGSSHQTPSVFYPGNHHVPEAHKKVHFVEYQKTTEINNNEKQVHEEKFDIETEADIFIKRKHKNFELAKMDTFMIN